jgi:hypothetical protein
MEKFYSDVYDILYDRSIHGKLLSVLDLKSIVAIYNRTFGTEKYVGGVISVSFANKNQLGAYTSSSKMVKIDLLKIHKKEVFEGVYGINISMLNTLFHELTHAYQFKQLNEYHTPYENYKDIELYLLVYSFFYIKYANNDKRLGEEDIKIITSLGINPKSPTLANDIKDAVLNFYRYNPSERMAEIRSLKILKDMLSIFDNKWNQMGKLDKLINDEMIRGYNKGPKDLCINSPSITFLRGLHFKKEIIELNNIIFTYRNELTNTKRLYLGIHTDDEIVKKLMKSRNI